MEIFKYLLQLYKGKDAIVKHISLFSLIGILLIFAVKDYAATWLNLLIENFYIQPPAGKFSLYLCVCALYLLLAYLIGYLFNLVENVAVNSDNLLPEFTLKPASIFLKLLPLCFVWGLYYFVMARIGSVIINNYQNIKYFYVFYLVLICLIPFVLLILCEYSSYGFKNKTNLYNPLYLLKVLGKTFADVLVLHLEMIIPIVFTVFVIYSYFLYSSNIEAATLLFAVRFFGICVSAYLVVILAYIYFIGLAKIANSKLIQK